MTLREIRRIRKNIEDRYPFNLIQQKSPTSIGEKLSSISP